jgi:hypothetical protein
VGKSSIKQKKETSFEGHASITQKFVLPLHIRSNFATKHILIKKHIESTMVGIKTPYITSSSTKNQVLYFIISI